MSGPARFWPWFEANGDRLLEALYGNDDPARAAAFDELRLAFDEVQPGGLRVELVRPPGAAGKEMVVSADGRANRVDAVKDLVASAPPLRDWTVVAFRRRMPVSADLALSIQGEQIGRDDVSFRLREGEEGIDLALFVRGLTKENERFRGLGARLLAEHTIGEEDCFLLRSLQVQPLPAEPRREGCRPFAELVATFDSVKESRYPTPGLLPVDLKSQWAAVKGTVGGAPLFGLVNMGLKIVTGHPLYDRALLVRIAYREVGPNGIPSSQQEFEQVGALCEAVYEALQKGQLALLTSAMTSRGRRELTFFTHDAEEALRRLEPLRASAADALETEVVRDTLWGRYRVFTAAEGRQG